MLSLQYAISSDALLLFLNIRDVLHLDIGKLSTNNLLTLRLYRQTLLTHYRVDLIMLHEIGYIDPTKGNLMDWKFYDIRLKQDDREKLEQWFLGYGNDPVAVMQELFAAGYKISMSWVDKQSAYVITLSGTKATNFNKQASISSWSDDILEGVVMCGYKHLVLADGGDWSLVDTQTSAWG